jgi:hypothetical protein
LAVWSLRLLFLTTRRQLHPATPETNAYEDLTAERFLFCVWHESIVLPLLAGKPRHMAALVSRHQDGSYLSESMELLGVKPVRGSTNRGGAEAVRQMMAAAADYHITITPDGPRGPRRQLKDGIVFLASQSGRAIVPMVLYCSRSWVIHGNWTDLILPKPFSTIYGVTAAPIRVPGNLSREQLAPYTALVQAAMDALYERADRAAEHETKETRNESRGQAA